MRILGRPEFRVLRSNEGNARQRIYLELEELRTYHWSMTTSQKDSCRAQYLCASLPWLCQSRIIKHTESYLRQLLTAHIYYKMNEENQTARADKKPVCHCYF